MHEATPRIDRPWRGKVGYVVMGFPRLSESFISNEMVLLESMGARLRVFAIKEGDRGAAHESAGRLRATVTRLPALTSLSGTSLIGWLARNAGAFRRTHFALLRRRPLPYLRTIAAAVSMCWRYRSGRFAPPRKVFVKEFLQAGYIASEVIADPDIAHLHGHFCHGATTVTWLASRMAGVSFSFTAHAKDIYQADQNPGDLLERKLLAAAFAVTCTQANHDHLTGRCGRTGRVHTVYHGLDARFFTPRERVAERSAPLLLGVGRFVEKKGLRHLIEACALLRARGQHFHCLLVGEEGPELPAIREAIARHRLEEVVTLQGPVDHATLRDLYAGAAIFVLPCLVASDGDRDGIPNVLAEAMATGLAVVSTPVSGIPELVEDGRNGVLVPERDAIALAGAIERLLADPARRAALGRAARATICRVFDSTTTTRVLKGLFERARPQLLAGRPAARPRMPGPAEQPA